MPREIIETERHARSAREQLAIMVGDSQSWLRIDKQDGCITPVGGVNVFRAAQGSYDKPSEVISTGRFQTSFAIYSRGDMLTAEEKQELL